MAVFYSISRHDPRLSGVDCSICLTNFVAGGARGHMAPMSGREGRVESSSPLHLFHKACLQRWISQKYKENQTPHCPECREAIVLSLKERGIHELKLMTKDALSGIAGFCVTKRNIIEITCAGLVAFPLAISGVPTIPESLAATIGVATALGAMIADLSFGSALLMIGGLSLADRGVMRVHSSTYAFIEERRGENEAMPRAAAAKRLALARGAVVLGIMAGFVVTKAKAVNETRMLILTSAVAAVTIGIIKRKLDL